MSTRSQELKAGIETALKNCGANAPGGGGFQEGNTCAGDGSKESEWSDGGKPASPAAANKLLENAGIHTSSKVSAQYNHRGEMAGGGGGTSKGVTIKKAGSSTRLSYSFGMGSHYTEYERTKATNELNSARAVLHKAGFQTRPLGYLKNTYEVQKKSSQKSLGEFMPTKSMEEIFDEKLEVKGGRGSGNFGHSGRPGQQGGSGDGDGDSEDSGGKRATDLQNRLVENIDGSQTFEEVGVLDNNAGIVGKYDQDQNEFQDEVINFLEANDYSTYSFSEGGVLTGDDGIVATDNEGGQEYQITFSTTSNRTPTATIIQSRNSKSLVVAKTSQKKSFSSLKSDITSRFEELEEEAALKAK